MGVLTTFLKVLTTVFNVLPLAVQVAELVARILRPGEKSGESKLIAVKEVIRGTVLASEVVGGKDIVNDRLFDEGLDEITGGAVKIMKAVAARTKG